MAVEIKLRAKYLNHVNGTQRSAPSGNAGVNRHRGEPRKQVKEEQQRITAEHQMALVLVGGRHRRFVRVRDLEGFLSAHRL
jgi:hypothetical protein